MAAMPQRGRRPPVHVTDPPPRLFSPPGGEANPSDERHTPRWLFDALGETFDLDPAAPPGGPWHVPADAYYTAADDGLALPWHGFVWLNPPYSSATPWASRMIEHGCGLMLAPLAAETRWVGAALAAAAAIVPVPFIKFEATTHAARHVSFGVMLYAFGDRAARAAARLPDAFIRAA